MCRTHGTCRVFLQGIPRNVVFSRCDRRAILEEAFSWVPDHVAEKLAEIEDEMPRSYLEEEKEDYHRGNTFFPLTTKGYANHFAGECQHWLNEREESSDTDARYRI